MNLYPRAQLSARRRIKIRLLCPRLAPSRPTRGWRAPCVVLTVDNPGNYAFRVEPTLNGLDHADSLLRYRRPAHGGHVLLLRPSDADYLQTQEIASELFLHLDGLPTRPDLDWAVLRAVMRALGYHGPSLSAALREQEEDAFPAPLDPAAAGLPVGQVLLPPAGAHAPTARLLPDGEILVAGQTFLTLAAAARHSHRGFVADPAGYWHREVAGVAVPLSRRRASSAGWPMAPGWTR